MTTEPTGHLPECGFYADAPYGCRCGNGGFPNCTCPECICDRLRACEARVLRDADMPRSEWERELVSRTLDAARDEFEILAHHLWELGSIDLHARTTMLEVGKRRFEALRGES